MIIVSTPKDPDAILDYAVDWASWLGADTLSTSTWTVPAGLTKVSDTHTTTTTTIWLSGGAPGIYEVTNHIVTAGTRAQDETLRLTVKPR